MVEKNKLLSIGEMSKLTKASVQSLRYYEQIELLNPAHVDEQTGYRYYSFDQKCLIELIQICLGLDIPLKKLKSFMGNNEMVNLYDILEYGKKISLEKLATIERGLHYIDELISNVDTSTPHASSPFYKKQMDTKYFSVVPYDKPLTEVHTLDIVKTVLRLNYDTDNYAELFQHGLIDIGVLSIYNNTNTNNTLNKTTHYMFTEVPKNITPPPELRIIEIPAGTYLCTQSQSRQIDKVESIFSALLSQNQPFIAIETDIFTPIYNINQRVNELRVLVLP